MMHTPQLRQHNDNWKRKMIRMPKQYSWFIMLIVFSNFRIVALQDQDFIDEASNGKFLTEEPDWDDVIHAYSYSAADKIVISIIMPIVVIVGIIGNVITIIVIVKHRNLRTSVNVYLANLAIADTLYLISAPDLIWTSYLNSPVHDLYDVGTEMLWFCQLNIYIVDTMLQVTIFTIFWMSVERYMAICHPFKFRNSKFGVRSRSIKICCVMWLIALAWQARKFAWITMSSYQLPWPDMYNGMPNSTMVCRYCYHYAENNCEIQNHLFAVDTFLALTLIVIVFGMYTAILITLKKSPFTAAKSTGNKSRSKSEKKVFLTVFLTVTIYIICTAPFGIMNLLIIYYTDLDYNVNHKIVNILRVANYINSSVNPIIYNAINEDFRNAFRDVFCCRLRRSRLP